MQELTVAVIIPALNEESAIAQVIGEIPHHLAAHVIVVDNGSTDGTAAAAALAGAHVIPETRRGYGAACLAGIRALPACDIVVFLDGDHSDYPAEMPALLRPLQQGQADLVVGSRLLGRREPGALPLHSLFGNWLAGALLRVLFRQPATDLGPFRAIRRESLDLLGMQDCGYGWTVEMQARAARRGLRVVEVPVRYRRRIGQSKITGSLASSVRAGCSILTVLLRVYLLER